MRSASAVRQGFRSASATSLVRHAAITAALAALVLLTVATVASAAVPGDLDWASYDTYRSDYYAVVAAPDGGSYAAGSSYSKNGVRKILLVRRAADGAVVWSHTYKANEAAGLALDSMGNVYVAAYVDAPGGATGHALLKVNPSGKRLWMQSWSGSAGSVLSDGPRLVVQPDGTASVADAEFGGPSAIVRQFTASGVPRWTWRSSDAGPDGGMRRNDLALDDAGNVYVSAPVGADWLGVSSLDPTGALRWTQLVSAPALSITSISTGGDRVCAAAYQPSLMSSTAALVAAFDHSGNVVYSQTLSTGPVNHISDVAVDNAGDAYVYGNTSVTSGYLTTTSSTLLKLDPLGTELWRQAYQSVGGSSAQALVVDDAGTSFVTGGVTIGGVPSLFVASYSSAGDERWLTTWNDGAGGSADARSMVLAGSSGLYVAGSTLVTEDTAMVLKFTR